MFLERWKLRALAMHEENGEMIDLPYTLIIEATKEPDYFGFYSPDLEGFQASETQGGLYL
jgi:hypothetical protein